MSQSPNKTKHTPGPWTLARNLGISSANGREILFPGHVSRGVDHAEREANARLIAAAPELLEALKDMTEDRAEEMELSEQELYNLIAPRLMRARAVIAKAEGRHV